MSNDNQLKYYNKFLCGVLSGCPEYDYRDKTRCINQHVSYMLDRTQSMFKWKGLPESIPQRVLELYLQVSGNVCFYKYDNELYVFTGGLGGEPNVYYMPTIYTIANPALKLSVNAKIDKDCIVMSNDSLYLGLMPMFSRYATGLTENELSIDIATTNARIIDLITAMDDSARESALIYLEEIRKGNLAVIADNAFLEGIKVQPYGGSGTNSITNLIELEQYYKASWYNELGLDANFNMKRESLNTSESLMNNDSLLPLVDDLLRCRRVGAEKVNQMFGTSITVDFDSSWKNNVEELKVAQEVKDIDIQQASDLE